MMSKRMLQLLLIANFFKDKKDRKRIVTSTYNYFCKMDKVLFRNLTFFSFIVINHAKRAVIYL